MGSMTRTPSTRLASPLLFSLIPAVVFRVGLWTKQSLDCVRAVFATSSKNAVEREQRPLTQLW